MIRLRINDCDVVAQPGETLLQAARAAGITIPTLCHHDALSAVGSCRVCLVESADGHLFPACKTEVQEGLVLKTDSPAVHEARKTVLELLLLNYRADGTREASTNSEFLKLVHEYDARRLDRLEEEPRFTVDSDPHPMIRVDLNQCILCTRCVRACEEVQGRFVWGVSDRGHESHLVAGSGATMLESGCESCGACVAFCPTGALSNRQSALPSDRRVTTTCSYCGVGCQFDLNVRDNRVVEVTSNPQAPVNGMALCVKGRYGFDFLHHPDRLTKPRVRAYLLEGRNKPIAIEERGAWVDVDLETALQLVVSRFGQIHQESGPAAFAFLASAKCTNEENYLVQKLARQVIGTHNVDHCARLCHSSTVAGLGMSYGSGAMSNTMRDVAEQAAAYFIIGSNTTEQHPVFGAQLRQAVGRRGAKLIVADPRRIDLCELATLHLRHRPGTDIVLLNGLMKLIVERGDHDLDFIQQRCEGFAEFLPSLDRYDIETVTTITGVPSDQLREAARILGESVPTAVIWAMGITQHTTGVLNVLALANLQMLLGNIGRPGGGVNPLRGQNNVQGACDMGALPNVFPGYQSVTDETSCRKFAECWKTANNDAVGCDSIATKNQHVGCDSIATQGQHINCDSIAIQQPGLTVTEMLDRAQDGVVRGLFILGEDPALTEPDSNHARHCLQSAEFVVLQEILHSETAPYADVLLPGAAFAEKDGTFTNTERRVQLVRRAIDPPEQARADWEILRDLGQRLMNALHQTPSGPQASWNYEHPRDVMAEIADVTPQYGGINYHRLERGDALHWPVPHETHPGTPILHVERFTRGKGKFHVVDHLPAKELPDGSYPYLLTTGRVLYHWHGGEMTRRVAGLNSLCPEPTVEIHPDDAALNSWSNGDWLRVRSRRGELIAKATITERVAPGVVFANFHFPGSGNANNLTINALDPIAKIPEFKVCAVAISSEAH